MAQTTTSITVAITSPTFRQITLASTANATVGRYVQIDNELMRLIAVNTTTGICDVERGISSKATNHGINSAAYIGEPEDFGSVGGSWAAGAKYVPKFTDTLAFFRLTPTAQIATAGAVTFGAGHLLGGLILRDPAGSGRADLVPTAANLVAAIPGAQVGAAFEFVIQNDADAAETITLTTNTGATMTGTMTIAQNNSKMFAARITNVTPGAEAYTVYNRGTFTT
jgi:hypothetical protein